MNGLASSFAWSLAPVTLVMAAGLLLERAAGRRGPALGAFVAAAALGLVIVSTVLAMVPRGLWWTWPALGVARTARHAAVASVAGDAQTATKHDGERVLSRAGVSLDGLTRWLDRAGAAAPASPMRASRVVQAAVAAAMGLALGRLLLGLWAVRRCRRRSRPIGEDGPLALVEGLRAAMGCRRVVRLAESSDLTGAATVGWLCPVVLLPELWRTWSEDDLRAVLAHEVAHVAAGDYPAGVVARLGVALHVYHPLAHLLAARLRLQQELAADALGVRLGGGRSTYLKVLSRMAIAQDERALGPARMFLAGRGTLIRRIEMLRGDRTIHEERVLGRCRRMVLASPLVIVALAASGLRGPARAEAPAAGDAKPRAETIDLSYIPPDVQGLIAVRPAAAFRHPGMASQAGRVRGLLEAMFPGSKLRIEDIEQVTAGVFVKYRTRDVKVTNPHGGKVAERLFMTSGFMARTTHSFDWKTEVERLLKRLGQGTLVEATHAGKAYWKFVDCPMLGPNGVSGVCFPDDRTIVVDHEKNLFPILEGKAKGAPSFARNADWDEVCGGLIAMVFDNRDDMFTPKVVDKDPEQAAAAAMFGKTVRLTLGLLDADNVAYRMIARSHSLKDAPAVASAGESLKKSFQKDHDGHKAKPCPCGQDHTRGEKILDEMVDALRIRAGDGSVEFAGASQVKLTEWVEALIGGELF